MQKHAFGKKALTLLLTLCMVFTTIAPAASSVVYADSVSDHTGSSSVSSVDPGNASSVATGGRSKIREVVPLRLNHSRIVHQTVHQSLLRMGEVRTQPAPHLRIVLLFLQITVKKHRHHQPQKFQRTVVPRKMRMEQGKMSQRRIKNRKVIILPRSLFLLPLLTLRLVM